MWNSARIKADSGVMRCETERGQAMEETGDALAAFACSRTSAAFLWFEAPREAELPAALMEREAHAHSISPRRADVPPGPWWSGESAVPYRTSWACCTSEMDGQGSWPFTSVTDANTFTTKYYPSRNLRNLTNFYKQQVELWYLGTTSVNSLRNITFLETNPGQLDMANLKVTLTCLDSPK